MDKPDNSIEKIEYAMDAMRRAMSGARERFTEGLQLTRTQIEILLMLVDGPRTTGELAHELFLTGSAVTQTVDTLVRRELIARHHDESDRRIIRLQLSATGESLTGNIKEHRHQKMKRFIAALSDTEVQMLITITNKFTQLIEDTKPPHITKTPKED
jgi:DNA-binding MarR family transcriptional regulator